jgi:divalent metal cation (Fe/Co/Zn/Cd) transporter
VDLHLEVDPNMTVRQSHEIAHDVRNRIIAELEWVADVLVHVEPYSLATIESVGQAPGLRRPLRPPN